LHFYHYGAVLLTYKFYLQIQEFNAEQRKALLTYLRTIGITDLGPSESHKFLVARDTRDTAEQTENLPFHHTRRYIKKRSD